MAGEHEPARSPSLVHPVDPDTARLDAATNTFRMLADPTRHETLADWARDTGASPRTVARLFRQELSTTFTQWRQQVLLAQAVALAAGRKPVNQIAAELGYASPSAFSAMVRRAVGMPPARFLGLQQ